MVERIAFTQSPRWRLSFSEWAWVLGSTRIGTVKPRRVVNAEPHY